MERRNIVEWVKVPASTYQEAAQEILKASTDYRREHNEKIYKKLLQTKEDFEFAMKLVPGDAIAEKMYEDCLDNIENFNLKIEKDAETLYESNRRCAHRVKAWNYDVSEYADEIRNEKIEYMFYFCYDIDQKLVQKFKISSGKGDEVSSAAMQKIELQIVNNPEIRFVTTMHNHPFLANAHPSSMDDYCDYRLRNFLQCVNKDLMDTCVVTPIDFYSRRQDESSDGTLISKSPVLGVRKCFTYREMMAIREKCPVIAQMNILDMTDSSQA